MKQYKYKTFGETLSRLMREKGYTVKELTQHMDLKSTNTVARLLTEKSSPQKIRSFCNDLLVLNPLNLVESEKQQLRDAVEVSSMGPLTYIANRQMLHFLKERPQSSACICAQSFGEGSMSISTLDDLFDSYTYFQSASVLLFNSALESVIRAVKILLNHCKDCNISVDHFIDANESRVQEIQAFTNILDVMGHPQYHFYFCPNQNDDFNFSNCHGNTMIVLKKDNEGNLFTDLLTFLTEDTFSLLYNLPGESSYQFGMDLLERTLQHHNPVKSIGGNEFTMENLLDYHQNLLEMDESHSFVCIRPDIALCMVPPEIAKSAIDSMLVEQTSFQNDILNKYLETVDKRHQLFINPRHQRHYLFSRSGIYNFAKYGKSKANIFGLRDLTPDESQTIISIIIDTLKKNPLIQAHLLKNELCYNGTSFLLYDNRSMLIDNYSYFQYFDKRKCFNSCWVNVPYITESFAEFVDHDLILNYTYTNEETIEFLESLIF